MRRGWRGPHSSFGAGTPRLRDASLLQSNRSPSLIDPWELLDRFLMAGMFPACLPVVLPIALDLMRIGTNASSNHVRSNGDRFRRYRLRVRSLVQPRLTLREWACAGTSEDALSNEALNRLHRMNRTNRVIPMTLSAKRGQIPLGSPWCTNGCCVLTALAHLTVFAYSVLGKPFGRRGFDQAALWRTAGSARNCDPNGHWLGDALTPELHSPELVAGCMAGW